MSAIYVERFLQKLQHWEVINQKCTLKMIKETKTSIKRTKNQRKQKKLKKMKKRFVNMEMEVKDKLNRINFDFLYLLQSYFEIQRHKYPQRSSTLRSKLMFCFFLNFYQFTYALYIVFSFFVYMELEKHLTNYSFPKYFSIKSSLIILNSRSNIQKRSDEADNKFRNTPFVFQYFFVKILQLGTLI